MVRARFALHTCSMCRDTCSEIKAMDATDEYTLWAFSQRRQELERG